MDAMILAAGLGTRLAPLTDTTPKALVDVGGTPMLERTARRLIDAGADRLIINVHAFPEQIERYVAERDQFGVEVVFSDERSQLLETGGAVRAAAPLLRRDQPFLLHNADVYSDIPLAAMLTAHQRSGALATAAVMERETTRALLFDESGLLGRVDDGKDLRVEVRTPVGSVQRLPFCGVHVIAPEFLDRITEEGAFSILVPYLRLAGDGARILPFRADGHTWIDIGRPEQLQRARELAG